MFVEKNGKMFDPQSIAADRIPRADPVAHLGSVLNFGPSKRRFMRLSTANGDENDVIAQHIPRFRDLQMTSGHWRTLFAVVITHAVHLSRQFVGSDSIGLIATKYAAEAIHGAGQWVVRSITQPC